MTQAPPLIFDSRRRHAVRMRAAARGAQDSFLLALMADELQERLACVSRKFENVLIFGPIAQLAGRILGNGISNITTDIALNEEALPYAPGSFDLIVSAGTLDSVNDLPGALIQIRRALRPDGLFLASLYGAGSLQTLKSAMLAADGDKVSAHIHPQMDLRMASELLTRSGFALPVADADMLEVRYGDWRRLVADLRDAGAGNAMQGSRAFVRALPARLDAAWHQRSDKDGKATEHFHFLHLTGWAPASTQPRPAARGSGQISLAAALKKPEI